MPSSLTLFPPPGAPDPATPALLDAVLAQARGWLREAFSRADAYHGVAHAEDVLRRVEAIRARLPAALMPSEWLVLATAVLLHDIGYAAHAPDWAPNRREHVPAGIALATERLARVPLFAAHPSLILAVAFLIAHHDDTSYQFPSLVWDGLVGDIELGAYSDKLAAFEVALPAEQRQRLRLLLAVLREADALTAAGAAGAARSFEYAVSRGLPLFAAGDPLGAWCWEVSAAGNTRLSAKRALLDAFTPEGWRLARESYRASEAYLTAVCAREGISYRPEGIAALLDGGALSSASAAAPPPLRIVRYSSEVALRAAGYARAGTNLRDAGANAYAMRHLPIAALALPPATGAVADAAAGALAALHAHLLDGYALSLFDLTGALDYELAGIAGRTLPPIVERHPSGALADDAEWVLAGGSATLVLARRLGVSHIWVAAAEAVE